MELKNILVVRGRRDRPGPRLHRQRGGVRKDPRGAAEARWGQDPCDRAEPDRVHLQGGWVQAQHSDQGAVLGFQVPLEVYK